MKKKGLIISTIVMVVVLIASLTTATYAWFTTTARAEVTAINVGVTTDAKVMIGVSKTNAFTTSTAIESNFMNGSVTFDAGSASDKWSGGQEGLGTSINTGLSMNGLTMATFSATGTGDDPTAYAIDASNAFNAAAAQWIKAPGNGTTIAENTQYQFAYANNRVVSGETVSGDYLDVTFGVRAAKANIEKIALVIGFDTTNTVNLGMAAAFNYWYQIKGGSASGLQEIYSQNYSAKIDDMSAPMNTLTSAAWAAEDGLSWTPAKGDATVILTIADGDGSALAQTDIYEIHLIIFLNGHDTDCNNSAASAGIASGSAIKLDFITVETA